MRSEESRGVGREPGQGVDFFLRAVRNGVAPSGSAVWSVDGGM